MTETWYVLVDGAVADPAEVVHEDDGRLVHKSGVAVAMLGDVPSSRGVDADEERAKQKKPTPAAKVETNDTKPEGGSKASYTTRESKAG